MVLCLRTAFIILLADINISGEMEDIRLTQSAITHHLGANEVYFVSAAISLLAFTSVVANYAYAESNLHFSNGIIKLDAQSTRQCIWRWFFGAQVPV
jgi:AGCS family alanine or glycine:cation symporter